MPSIDLLKFKDNNSRNYINNVNFQTDRKGIETKTNKQTKTLISGRGGKRHMIKER